jgi:ABC-2 type transport system ATP-binding protein
VETSELRRTFTARKGAFVRHKREIEAVCGITFSIERGELFGLLGPNGAGKTTTIKMLITLLLPTRGSARVLGLDVVSRARDVRRHIGYSFGGDRGLYDRLSATDNLRYFAELYGVPPRTQRTRIAELIELVGLRGREDDRVEAYSRGMRQRLHIARALMHDPDVLFLDEPTTGIDPVGARELRATIAMLLEQGKTILLTTHYMFEADELCDRVAVIRSGEVVAQGTPQDLKQRASTGGVVEVEAFGVADSVIDAIRRLRGVRSVMVEQRDQAQVLNVRVGPDAEVTPAILAELNGARIGRIESREPTLEDAYVELVSGA